MGVLVGAAVCGGCDSAGLLVAGVPVHADVSRSAAASVRPIRRITDGRSLRAVRHAASIVFVKRRDYEEAVVPTAKTSLVGPAGLWGYQPAGGVNWVLASMKPPA
jgi:hypothetical protein